MQTVYLLISVKDSGYSTTIKDFLSAFDFSLLEFRFLKLTEAMTEFKIVDDFIPLRGVYGETVVNVYGMYFNTIVANVFCKILIWALFFGITLPISIIARRLFGQDSENMFTWPDKYLFSGTMMIFFAMH
jgi:hypothetical protein